MLKLTSLLFSIFILIPNSVFGVYDSFEDLQDHLGEAGYPVIMKLKSGEFNTKVYVSGRSGPVSIDEYANSNLKNRARKSSFDFINQDTGVIEYEAYKVADVFVCYMQIVRNGLLPIPSGRAIRRATFEMIKSRPDMVLAENFDFCLIIPAPIDQVERALARVKESNSNQVDSTQEENSVN